MENKVHVIYWKYSDGSDCGVIKAYDNAETAEADLKMLNEHCNGMRVFKLAEVVCSDA